MFSDYKCIIGQLGIYWVIEKNIKEIHNYTTSCQTENFFKKCGFHVNHSEYMLDFILCTEESSSKTKPIQKKIQEPNTSIISKFKKNSQIRLAN